jgi:hypothetical protein
MAKRKSAERALFEVLSGKRKASTAVLLDKITGKTEKQATEALVSLLPKKQEKIDDATQEFLETVNQLQEQIDLKRANAIGVSLINLLNKANSIEDVQAKEEIKIKFGDIISTILIGLIEQNDPKYQDIFHIAVGLLYKYLNEDLKKMLRKQKDVLDGKVQYYKDDPIAGLGMGDGSGGGGGDPEEIARLTSYVNVLEAIYNTTIVNNNYQIEYITANVILVDASKGNVTVTLPLVTSNVGRPFIVKKVDNSPNIVNVISLIGETITGPTIITNPNDVIQFYSADGLQWFASNSADVLGCFLVSELAFQWSSFDANLTWADLKRIEFRRPRTLL